jgi:hypothetical protein
MEWWQIQELLITLAIIVGLLVPVLGLTWRFVLRSTAGGRARLEREASARLQNERIEHMERQLEEMESLVRRLVDATEFDRRLKSGEPPDGEG